MKKLFHRTGSFTLALLVLLSTMSFTVDKHFCGEMLVDRAVFSEAKSCGMHDDNSTSSEKPNPEDICCSKQQVSIEGQDELSLSYDELDLQQQVFLASFTYSYIKLFEGQPKQVIPFKHYSPPLLVRDVQLLDQVFLI